MRIIVLLILMGLAPFASAVESNDLSPIKTIHPASSLPRQQNTGSILAAALKAENTGNLITAISLLKPVYQHLPDNALVRLNYARVLIENGEANKAIAVVQPLVNKNSQDWRPWFWLGSAQLMSGDLENAAESLDAALDREGKVMAIWVQRAIVAQQRGKTKAALSLLQVAYGIEPKNADVVLNYAYTLEQAGQLKKALNAYQLFLQMTAAKPHYGTLRRQILQRLDKIAAGVTAYK